MTNIPQKLNAEVIAEFSQILSVTAEVTNDTDRMVQGIIILSKMQMLFTKIYNAGVNDTVEEYKRLQCNN